MAGRFVIRAFRAVPMRSAALAALLGALALAGCGGSAPLFTQDGRPTTQAQCAEQGGWDNCMQQARGICSGDFDVIQRSVAGGARNLLFACKAQSTQ